MSVKSANEISALIAEMKSIGISDMVIAWEAALACVGWSYVYGARGEYCDPSNRRSRARDDHPTIKSKCKNFNGKDSDPAGCVGCQYFAGTASSDESKHEGRTRFFDCRGFTYWILRQVYEFVLKGAGATTQWNTASNWKSKGEISTMPKDTLCCLFVRKGSKMEHTGFGYNSETVECSVGVQYFANRKSKWTHWAVPKCVDSDITPVPVSETKPTLSKGSSGSYVSLLQTMLIQRGYSLPKYGADGKFGNETLEAVKGFQNDYGITADGVVGEKTWQALEGAEPAKHYTVTIPGLTFAKAEALSSQYTGAKIVEERG